jgi:hypothetical protein
VTVQELMQVMVFCNLYVLVHQFSLIAEVQGCLFHKCKECTLPNTTWCLILTYLTRMNLGIHFLIMLCQTNQQYLIWWTIFLTQELFTGLHETKPENKVLYKILEMSATFNNALYLLFSSCNLFFDGACVRNGLCDFDHSAYSRTPKCKQVRVTMFH